MPAPAPADVSACCATGLTAPTVRHHLTVLTESGLFTREQRGQWAWVRANEDRIRNLATLFA